MDILENEIHYQDQFLVVILINIKTNNEKKNYRGLSTILLFSVFPLLVSIKELMFVKMSLPKNKNGKNVSMEANSFDSTVL